VARSGIAFENSSQPQIPARAARWSRDSHNLLFWNGMNAARKFDENLPHQAQQGFVPQSFDFEAARPSRPDPPPAGIGSSISRLSSMPEVIALKIWRSCWPKPKVKPEKIKPPQLITRGGCWFPSVTLESRRRKEPRARRIQLSSSTISPAWWRSQ